MSCASYQYHLQFQFTSLFGNELYHLVAYILMGYTFWQMLVKKIRADQQLFLSLIVGPRVVTGPFLDVFLRAKAMPKSEEGEKQNVLSVNAAHSLNEFRSLDCIPFTIPTLNPDKMFNLDTIA